MYKYKMDMDYKLIEKIYTVREALKAQGIKKPMTHIVAEAVEAYLPTLTKKEGWKMITGEKYIYLTMAYQLAKANKGQITIGNDNGFVGGQKYYRGFGIHQWDGKILLTETKSSKHFADFHKTYEVREGEHRPYVLEYIENGENHSKNWIH